MLNIDAICEKTRSVKTAACEKVVALKGRTSHGFEVAEHACAITYALNEFFHLHILHYVTGPALLITGFLLIIIRFVGTEI